MIYQGTLLRVVDNSGAKFAQCIKVLRKTPTGRARLGDKIVVVIKKAIPDKKVRAHEIHRAIIVRDPNWVRRPDGTYIKFINPGLVILKKDGSPIAKRILGPVSKELRKRGHLKIISIASLAI